MVNCTSLEVFKAKMDNLIAKNKEVFISVIKNFICDAVRGVADKRVVNGLCEKAIKDYLKTVHENEKWLPGSKFALAQPIFRPGEKWYSEKFDDLCRYHTEGINSMGSIANLAKLEPLSRMSQNLNMVAFI
jgi:hypothetical protein